MTEPIYHLDRQASGPLYVQLKEQILHQVRLGGLRAGDRLPPTRDLARRLGINRGTVSAAYDELLDEGVLRSHVGRGTFVASEVPQGALRTPAVADGAIRWADHFAGAEPATRRRFPDTGGARVIPFHRNVPDETLFPSEAFRVALDSVLREEGGPLLGYAPAEGYPGFAEFLRSYAAETRGIEVDPGEVLVVNGSQQALDLICRTFLRPGDTVAVEEPTYTGALDLFRSFDVPVVAVPTDAQGILVDEAETLLARERPRFLYVMPTYQNPTGRSWSPLRRKALVSLAARFEVPVGEDDFDGELFYEEHPPAPLKSLPGSRGVIYIGTPSKTLFPGLRIGWILADAPVVDRLSRLKQVADLSGSQLLQAAFARFAAGEASVEHKLRVREVYRARRDHLLAALETHLPRGSSWTRPDGGMSLLVTLPAGADAEAVLAETAPRGILFTPGRWFFLGNESHRLRLCFGSVADSDIEPAVRVLSDAVRTVLGRSPRPGPAAESALPSV